MAARHILQFVHTCKLFKDFTINYSMGGKIIALTDYTDLNVSTHPKVSKWFHHLQLSNDFFFSQVCCNLHFGPLSISINPLEF